MRRDQPTFRFAPSPTGELHLGHVLSALINWRWAQRLDGRFLLRIEDIDKERSRQHFVDQIYEDLTWLGLAWEQPVRRQSQYLGFYRAVSVRLQQRELLYPCFATRSEIKAACAQLPDHPLDPDGVPLYPKLHKHLSASEIVDRKAAGQPYALRLDMDRALEMLESIKSVAEPPLQYLVHDERDMAHLVDARPERWGDAVIVRKDVSTSYHLSVVMDDAKQQISHVVRGRDLEAATDLHSILQILLGLRRPVYHHHRLLLDADGCKFSKSNDAFTLRSLRESGMTKEDVFRLIEDY